MPFPKNKLPDYLSIREIVKIFYPDPENETEFLDSIKRAKLLKNRESAIEYLIAACKNGLPYQGDIKGWKYQDGNPYPLANPGIFLNKVSIFPGNGCYLGSETFAGSSNQVYIRGREVGWHHCEPSDCTIHKDYFKLHFSQDLKKWLVNDSMATWLQVPKVIAVLDESQTAIANNYEYDSNDAGIRASQGETILDEGIRESQIRAILDAAKKLEYADLLNIPEGGRAAIKAYCNKNTPGPFKTAKYELSNDSFKNAWQCANEAGLIRIENKEKYLRKKNNSF